MSIQYDLYDTPDIQQTGDAQPLHPRVVFKGTIDQEEFLDPMPPCELSWTLLPEIILAEKVREIFERNFIIRVM